MDQSRKHINSTVLSSEETRDLAKVTAQNILVKMKELGYPLPHPNDILKEIQDGGNEEDDDDGDGEGEEEEEEVGEQKKEEPNQHEEEEELIHMYSDEEFLEPSISILDPNYH